MADYSAQRAIAQQLITDAGKAVTLTRVTKGDYDPATGGNAETTSTLSGNGVFLRFSNREIDGTTILSSDRKLIYYGAEPKVNDIYGFERVINVKPLDPDESGAIMYTCQLRK